MPRERFLIGTKEISDYTGRSWPTIARWIREEGFPAKKMEGVWESNKDLIDEWRRKLLEGLLKKN